jgi:WD40 repeat protein
MPQASKKRFRPIIRVFVSSTFSDLVHERNALQDRVWPELERYCLLHGFQFQAIDLRWGVPTEAGLDHRTMRICFDELRRSQEVSPRPNFLILLGDRYGWQPLPEEITTDEFQLLRSAASDNSEQLKVLEDWYRLDTNSRPAMHLLRSRRESPDTRDYTKDAGGRDTDAWTEVQRVLWSLVNCAFPPSKLPERFAEAKPGSPMPSIVRFQGSATEQEIWRGAFDQGDAQKHVVAFSRDIGNLGEVADHPRLRDFANVDEHGKLDEILHEAIGALKTKLRNLLDDNYLTTAQPAHLRQTSDADGKPQLEVSTNHLDSLCDQIRNRLRPIIEQQITEYKRVPEVAEGTCLTAEVLRDLKREREEHARFAAERAPVGGFVGREAERAKVLHYLDSVSQRPFVLHGLSGSGKSALMAAAAREAAGRPGAIVIERYLGTTSRSSDLRSLLIDLCQSLRELFPLAHVLPTDLRLIEKEFYDQLKNATAERPIYIFLDALDQLDSSDDAHLLWWIRSTPLPTNVGIVVSCMSDPSDEMPFGPWAAIKQRGFLTEDNSTAIEHLEPQEAQSLWTRWLDQASRNLTADQQVAIDERILKGTTDCRQPLYMRILFEEARRWPSYTPPPPLGASVPELLQSLFKRLGEPAAHGPLVEPALAYLVSARYGLAESELLEILFRDADYKQQLLRSALHALPHHASRIPIAIWSRLRYDLSPYLSERGAPGGSVLQLFHRQVGDYVRRRFADTSSRRYQWHRRLALYFARQHWWLESRVKQRERMRLPYSARPAHVRKITELPGQLLAAAREAEAAGLHAETEQALKWIEQLFQKLQYLEAKNEAGLIFDLVVDFSNALKTLPDGRSERGIIKLLDEALRRDIHFIARHSADYPQGLFQCLWNTCWWFDCDEVAGHYMERKSSLTAIIAPLVKGSKRTVDGKKLSYLLLDWRADKEQTAPSFCWLRSRRPPFAHLGTGQLNVLRGHKDEVQNVAFSPDGRWIVSGSGTFRSSGNHGDYTVRVWNAKTGDERYALHGHKGVVHCLAISPDGRWIVSGSGDQTVRIWDAITGQEHRCVKTTRAVQSVGFSPDGHSIVYAGSIDGTISVWATGAGEEIRRLDGHFLNVRGVAFSPNGRSVVCATHDTVWREHRGTFSEDGLPMESPASDDAVRLWDVETGHEVRRFRGHKSTIHCVAFSPDGRWIVSGASDKTVVVWNAKTGAPIRRLHGHKSAVNSVAFSPDGRWIVSGSCDKTIRVWPAAIGPKLYFLITYKARFWLERLVRKEWYRVWNAETAPFAKRATPESSHRMRMETWVKRLWSSLWDMDRGLELHSLRGHEGAVTSVSLSPDSRRIISGLSDRTIRVWDVKPGIALRALHNHEHDVQCVTFSADGRRIASGSKDKTVRIWDVNTGHELRTLCGHEDWVTSVEFSPDGRRIVCGSRDSTARVWNVESGQAMHFLYGHENWVNRVAFSPDGQRIITATDRVVRMWDISRASAFKFGV